MAARLSPVDQAPVNWAEHQPPPSARAGSPRFSRWNAKPGLSVFIPLAAGAAWSGSATTHYGGPRFRHHRAPSSFRGAGPRARASLVPTLTGGAGQPFNLAENPGRPAWPDARWCWNSRGHEVSTVHIRAGPYFPAGPGGVLTSLTWCAKLPAVGPVRWRGVRLRGGRGAQASSVNGADVRAVLPEIGRRKRPDFVQTVGAQLPLRAGQRGTSGVSSPDGRPRLAWVITLGCTTSTRHPVRPPPNLVGPPGRAPGPNLRPVPGCPMPQIRDVAMVAPEVLAEPSADGWPRPPVARHAHLRAGSKPNWGSARLAARPRRSRCWRGEIERRLPPPI